jgi:hypothetical protein
VAHALTTQWQRLSTIILADPIAFVVLPPRFVYDAVSWTWTKMSESEVLSGKRKIADAQETRNGAAAISMTLCELATATHHSPPLECASFTVDSEASFIQTQGECVEFDCSADDRNFGVNSNRSALSRSAQFWSSYSGYLREVRKYNFSATLYAADRFSSSTLFCLSPLERHR